MNIGSNSSYPSSALSNFTARRFMFEGVLCASMEGLLQAFKFENMNAQANTCALIGYNAKFKGKKRNKRWKSMQTLWWQGKAYKRDSSEYQKLLDRAYSDLYFQDSSFRKALDDCGNAIFTHSIGHNNEKETVLTEREFCSRLQYMKDYGALFFNGEYRVNQVKQ